MLATAAASPSRIPIPSSSKSHFQTTANGERTRFHPMAKKLKSKIALRFYFARWIMLTRSNIRLKHLELRAKIHKNCAIRQLVFSEWVKHVMYRKKLTETFLLAKTRLNSLLLKFVLWKWRKKTQDSIQETKYGRLLDERYARTILRQYYYMWLLKSHAMNLRLAQVSIAKNLKQSQFNSILLRHWKFRYYQRKIDRLQFERATLHYESGIRRKVVNVWLIYVTLQNIHRIHSNIASDFYSKLLLSLLYEWRFKFFCSLRKRRNENVAVCFESLKLKERALRAIRAKFSKLESLRSYAGHMLQKSLIMYSCRLLLFWKMKQTELSKALDQAKGNNRRGLLRTLWAKWIRKFVVTIMEKDAEESALNFRKTMFFRFTIKRFRLTGSSGLQKFHQALVFNCKRILSRNLKKWKEFFLKHQLLHEKEYKFKTWTHVHGGPRHIFLFWKSLLECKDVIFRKRNDLKRTKLISWQRLFRNKAISASFLIYQRMKKSLQKWKSTYTLKVFKAIDIQITPSQNSAGTVIKCAEPIFSPPGFKDESIDRKLEIIQTRMSELVMMKEKHILLEQRMEFLRCECVKASRKTGPYQTAILQLKLLEVEEELGDLKSTEEYRKQEAEYLLQSLKQISDDIKAAAIS